MTVKFKAIEKKWQNKWEKAKIFEVNEKSKKPKYYVLEMFPYPSGSGLHMGHAWNYVIGDILTRLKIMQGFNVLHPMGYDSLGLPAENAAIESKTSPQKYTQDSTKNYIKQQKALGLSYDWSRVLSSADSEYYKWDQWIFLQMLKKGLAYQKKSSVNWCPKCNTVLANEQVHDGKCWRHEGTKVEMKNLKQWFLKITNYANELYEEIDKLKDWPEKTKMMQKYWIGKSYGTEIDFKINGKKWPIFTTRPDTLCGVTFMVVSAQHEKILELTTREQEKEVKGFLKKLKSVSEKELAGMEKQGVFTGSYAINPINNEKIPIYAGNFVLADYGSGMVMAVPAHDQRDFEFAKKYDIKIKQVIVPELGKIKQNKEIERMFNVVKEVYNKLESEKIKVWFNGTFGVMGHCNNIFTKPNDVDCGVLTKNFKKAQNIIKNLDYNKREEKNNGKFKVVTFEKKGIILQIGTFDKDLGNKIVKVNNVKYRVPGAGWLSECYKITSKKEKRRNMNDFERAIFLESISGGFSQAYTGKGKLCFSGDFSGMDSEKAKQEITKFLIKNKFGKKKVQFKLRDWGISRQRYWGTPIPIIHCEECGAVPVLEKDLPVKLPRQIKFGKGNPLETNEKWLKVKCPKCGGKGRREAETMDTFANSSWYFLRYCDAKNNKQIFDKKKVDYWCPVDSYIGGTEHICMHLIYFRFYTKFLADLGLLKFREPVKRLFHQGMLHAEDGEKMSKSKNNVVLPETVSDKYGIDTARFFLCSLASPDKDIDWSKEGIIGSLRFINKVFDYFEKVKLGKSNVEVEEKLNLTIKNVTEYFENFKYRKATIELRELFDLIYKENENSKSVLEKFLQLLNVICPHITEELWSNLGNKDFISTSKWPKAEKSKIKAKDKKIDLNEKYANYVGEIIKKLESRGKEIKKVYLYVVPFEIDKINEKKIRKRLNKNIKIYSVKDSKKFDPENKSKKARPGMPGVYLE